LPDLIGEFVDMSKEYLRQETIEPARQLGRFAGYSIGAGAAFAVGTLFLAIAGLRWLLEMLPEKPYWEGLGYVIAALVLGGVAAVIVGLGARDPDEGS
jgi:hypothetical protein